MKLLGKVREVFGTIKHRKPSAIFCPRCCSAKIALHSSLDFWLTPKKYLCHDCGYLGPLIMELEKEEEKKKDSSV